MHLLRETLSRRRAQVPYFKQYMVEKCSETLFIAYSWIGRPVQTHIKLICRETERATADLNTRMKSSRQGASNGAEVQASFLFLVYFWTITSKIMIMVLGSPHSWMRLVKESSNTEVSDASEVPQSRGKLIF